MTTNTATLNPQGVGLATYIARLFARLLKLSESTNEANAIGARGL